LLRSEYPRKRKIIVKKYPTYYNIIFQCWNTTKTINMHYKQIDNSKMIFYYPKKVSSKFSTVGPPLFANVNDELAVKEELYAFNYMYKNLDKIPL